MIRTSSVRRSRVALGLLLIGCGNAPNGLRPVPGAAGAEGVAGSSGAEMGGSAALGRPIPAGGSGGSTCTPLELPAASIVGVLSPVLTTLPTGTFTACQNDECLAGLRANVAVLTPHRVLVAVGNRFIRLEWNDRKDSYTADTYRLEYTAPGSTQAEVLFSKLVGYGVVPTAPEAGLGVCPGVVFTAQIELEDPIDLEPLDPSRAGAAGAE